jgi:soluble lytic murein transglycosylase-like protein
MTRISILIALLMAAAQSPAQSPTPLSISERQMESAKQMADAANRQRAAAQIQTTPNEADSFFSAGWSGPAMLPPPLPNCPALPDSETEPLIRAAATRSGLNPVLVKAVIRQESGFKPCVISEKGAMGLMQVMPETAQALGTKDPFDPAENIDAGTRYLKQMLTRFKGDIRLALAAYNAGPEKVDGPKPAVPDIAETRDYVESITAALHNEPAELPQNNTPKN